MADDPLSDVMEEVQALFDDVTVPGLIQDAVLTTNNQTGYDDANSAPTFSTVTSSLRVMARPYTTAEIEAGSGLILQNDLLFTFQTGSLRVTERDVITYRGTPYKVVLVRKREDVALFEVTGRSV